MTEWESRASSSGRLVRVERILRGEDREVCPGFPGARTVEINKFRMAIKTMVESTYFDFSLGCIILLNALIVGVEVSYRVQGQATQGLERAEYVFLIVYSLELTLRLLSYGLDALRDNWVKFDAALICLSVGTLILISSSDINLQQIGDPLGVAKIVRLIRLARTLRILSKFRSLWMLVSGLIFSGKMLIHAIVLLGLILYVFAIIGMEVITLDQSYKEGRFSEKYNDLVDEHFTSLPAAMLSLLQFMCMDSIAAIYRPMIKQRGTLVIYFAAVILLVAVVFMNIVTAVLVNGALEQAAQDKAVKKAGVVARKKRLMKELYEMFIRLDTNKSGHIERHEIMNATDADKALLFEFMELESPLHVFDQLDIDGTGTLDIIEFAEGLYEAAISKNPTQLRRMSKQISMLDSKQHAIWDTLQEVQSSILTMSRLMEMMRLDMKVERRSGCSEGPYENTFDHEHSYELQSFTQKDSLRGFRDFSGKSDDVTLLGSTSQSVISKTCFPNELATDSASRYCGRDLKSCVVQIQSETQTMEPVSCITDSTLQNENYLRHSNFNSFWTHSCTDSKPMQTLHASADLQPRAPTCTSEGEGRGSLNESLRPWKGLGFETAILLDPPIST